MDRFLGPIPLLWALQKLSVPQFPTGQCNPMPVGQDAQHLRDQQAALQSFLPPQLSWGNGGSEKAGGPRDGQNTCTAPDTQQVGPRLPRLPFLSPSPTSILPVTAGITPATSPTIRRSTNTKKWKIKDTVSETAIFKISGPSYSWLFRKQERCVTHRKLLVHVITGFPKAFGNSNWLFLK